MEKKQVSPTQIEALFKFMRRKYVRYYDVQIELVDHFASAIEITQSSTRQSLKN